VRRCVVLQTVPQAPQLLPSIELSASQPLNLLLSQVRYEPEHMGAHGCLRTDWSSRAPCRWSSKPCRSAQLPGLFCGVGFEPSVAPPVQSPNPLLQTARAGRGEQVEVAFGYLVLQSLRRRRTRRSSWCWCRC